MKRLLLIGALTLLVGACAGPAAEAPKPTVFVRFDGRPTSEGQFEADKAICAGEASGRAAYSQVQWHLLSGLGDNFNRSYERGRENRLEEERLQERASAKIARFRACMAERGYIVAPPS